MIVFQATMCGILLILQCKDCTCELGNLKEKLVGLLKNRGPDNQNSVQFTSENGMKFYMHASLLWLRGSEPKTQPIVKDENFLLWNGDLFNIDLPDVPIRADVPSDSSPCGILSESDVMSTFYIAQVRYNGTKSVTTSTRVFFNLRLGDCTIKR